jgi:hypothetical protein
VERPGFKGDIKRISGGSNVVKARHFEWASGSAKRSNARSRNGFKTMIRTPRREHSCNVPIMRGWFVPGLWPMVMMGSQCSKSSSEQTALADAHRLRQADAGGLAAHVDEDPVTRIDRIASITYVPCDVKISTCRSFAILLKCFIKGETLLRRQTTAWRFQSSGHF